MFSMALQSTSLRAVIQDLLPPPKHPVQQVDSERVCLLQFCQTFKGERNFSLHRSRQTFVKLLHLLKTNYITEDWLIGGEVHDGKEKPEMVHAVLMTVRLLLRDERFQHLFMETPSPCVVLSNALSHYTNLYFNRQDQVTLDVLKELTNIFQKISNTARYHNDLIKAGAHSFLVQLLSSRDLVPLQCSLCALVNLCKSETGCGSVSALSCATPLLNIISSYDNTSKRLGSDLLLLLSQHSSFWDQMQDIDGLPICLKFLHSDDLHILHRVVGVLERLAESSDYQDDIRLLGGIPLLLSILSKQTLSPSSSSKENLEKVLALQAACCSAITQLVLNDTNAQHIVQGNGVYLIAVHMLPLTGQSDDQEAADQRLKENLQKTSLRALRYLFSMERNRRVFKKLFPPQLFETFIDIGHYTRELDLYTPLMISINTLPESERAIIQGNIDATNLHKAPIFSIGGYSVLELLGSGAFGSVYKVCKQQTPDNFLALKEIRSTHPTFGRTLAERSRGLGKLMNEVNIIKEQLRHPNVVRYYKCFQEGDHLYIVMELLEGAPLYEHINSLQEKGQNFSESRLWKIFTQLVLALRYIHKEKHIIHRDLSPSNIMLGEEDKLTITDFGLAKQKQREFSVMKSVVGTMLYWCPELVQSEPYTEKADIWAAGCILYQMATLKPPFYATNVLSVAKKIAEVDYPPIPEENYSPLVSQVVQQCLTADSGQRPDSVQLGSLLSGVLMQQMDQLALLNDTLDRRLAKEKQRTIRHFHKAVWSEQRYQQLLSSSSGYHHHDNDNEDEQPNPFSLGGARRKLSTCFGTPPSATAGLQARESTESIDGLHVVPSELSERGRNNDSNSGDEIAYHHSRGSYRNEKLGVETTPRLRRDSLTDVSTSDGVTLVQSRGESTDGGELCTPLQRSSDNVFVEDDPNYTFQSKYPSNLEFNNHHRLTELTTRVDTSPQVSKTRQRRPNPLTSHTNVVRTRSHSAILPSRRESEPWLVSASNRSPLSRHAMISRAQSVFLSGQPQQHSPTATKIRTMSTSSTLSISPRHLREISDPITQLLGQLHKLVYISQLPPSQKPSARQTIVEQYKRSLFDASSSMHNLKSEMHKLVNGVSEKLCSLGPGDTVEQSASSQRLVSSRSRILHKALEEVRTFQTLESGVDLLGHFDAGESSDGQLGLTYELLQIVMESLLVEKGYYKSQ